MQEKSLKLLACFCNTTYRQQMSLFDIPLHYETRCEEKADGKMRIIQMPVNDFQPKGQNSRYLAFMESSGDLYAKTCFDRFIQDSCFTRCTAEIAEAFGMPEEGLLCILKQYGIIVERDDEDGWEIAEALKDSGLTLVKAGIDGKPETQWTYKGGYFVWLVLTRDCKVRPCYERTSH